MRDSRLLWGRADRLLLQRMRKSQSGTTLYGDSLVPPPLPPPAEPLHPAVTAAAAAVDPVMYPTLEAGQSSQRLLVVANRLPVSAHKDREGSWQFEVTTPVASATLTSGVSSGWVCSARVNMLRSHSGSSPVCAARLHLVSATAPDSARVLRVAACRTLQGSPAMASLPCVAIRVSGGTPR